MKFSKTRQVKSPQRGTPHSAGIDFFIPSFTKKFIADLLEKNEHLSTLIKQETSYVVDKTITLMPQHRILIPSGIHVNFTEEELALRSVTNLPLGLSLNANNKSGVASKKGLDYLACIDENTVIETNKGKFTAQTLTKDFITKNNILIKSFNESLKIFEYKKFDGFRTTGEKECVTLHFDNNTTLTCSIDHAILTNRGWILAKDLIESDIFIF